MLFIAIAILIALIIELLWAFLTFDQLIRLEYKNYKTDWEKDGMPYGFFWIPPELRLFPWKGLTEYINKNKIMYKSALARGWLMLSWLFSIPGWMRGDPEARKLIYRLRVLTAIWNIGIVSIFLVLIFRFDMVISSFR